MKELLRYDGKKYREVFSINIRGVVHSKRVIDLINQLESLKYFVALDDNCIIASILLEEDE